MRSSITALLAACPLLAGCASAATSVKFQGEQANVARAISDYSSDAKGRNTNRICNQVFAPELAKKLGNCQTVVGNQLNSADSYDLAVQSVTIAGASAQARVKSTNNGKDRFDTLLLTHGADARWRISGLG